MQFFVFFSLYAGPLEYDTGFPKDARFSKMKNTPDLISIDKEGKIIGICTLNI